LQLSEEEISNAICLHTAERKQIKPTDVKVELMWDEELGFSAEIFTNGRNQILVEANILEAIERYVHQQYNIRVFRNQIRLELEDEITAEIDNAS
jgi:hypothetical protein